MSLLNEFCQEFGVKLTPVIKIGRSYFTTTPAVEEFLKREPRHLLAAGVPLGEEKETFTPSLALLELLAQATKEHKVVVDEKAAWLFLCGRDLFAKGILHKGVPTKSGYYLVMNEHGENLGLGRMRRRGNIVVAHILDRGSFLRREKRE